MSLMFFSPFCRLIAGKENNIFSPYTSRVVAALFPSSLRNTIFLGLSRYKGNKQDHLSPSFPIQTISWIHYLPRVSDLLVLISCIHTSLSIPLCCVNRVIHLSSGLGNLAKLSKPLQDRIMSPDLTVEGLSNLMDQFLR